MIYRENPPESTWRESWGHWWDTLEQIEGGEGDPWDPDALAVFLDVAALGLLDVIPVAVEQDFAIRGSLGRPFRTPRGIRATRCRGLCSGDT